jgi:hypothetical protein
LKKYPIASRLILFSLPFIFLPLAEGAQQVWLWARGRWRAVALLFILALVGPTMARALVHFARPEETEEIRPVLAYVAKNRLESDVLYVYSPAYPAFRYYAPRYGLDKPAAIRGIHPANGWAKFKENLQQLRGKGRVWVILSHFREDERRNVLGYMDEMGTRLSDIRKVGSEAYLYDMKPAPEAHPPGAASH